MRTICSDDRLRHRSEGPPHLTIVTVTWNNHQRLESCLRSLAPHEHHIQRVAVVDNCDDENEKMLTRDVITSSGLQFSHMVAGGNIGFSRGVDEALAKTRPMPSEWVVLLNDDAEVGVNFGATLQWNAERAHPQFAMMQCPLVYAHDTDRIASLGLKLTERASGEDLFEGVLADSHEVNNTAMTSLFCPMAGAAMYRVDALEKARMSFGIMDPRHFLYYEDLDLGWRLRLLGYEPWTMLGMAPVKHVVSHSVKKHPKSWIRAMQERNRVRTFIRNASEAWIDRGLFRIVEDAEDAARELGEEALQQLDQAVTESWLDRRELDGKLDPGAREELERRWFKGGR